MKKDKDSKDLKEKILKGLDNAFQNLVQSKKEKNSYLIVFRKNKIVKIKP